MMLKIICGVLASTSMAIASFAQPPVKPRVMQQPAATVTYASAADVAALVARAKKESNNDAQMVVGNILQLAPNDVLLEYRPAGESVKFPAGTHAKEAELFYVIEGSGTLMTGGTLTPDHMGIEGGVPRKVSKGDFIFIPEGTPHWFSHVDQTLALMSVKVPRSVPAQ